MMSIKLEQLSMFYTLSPLSLPSPSLAVLQAFLESTPFVWRMQLC